MRIVSLLASATEIVCALGCGDLLVGRSHECDNPAWVRQLPCCSETTLDLSISSGEIDTEVRRRLRAGEPLYRIDSALIEALRPDFVLMQTHCDVCAVTADDVNRPGTPGVQATQIALSAFSVQEIFDSIRQVARALGLEKRGEELVRRECMRLAEVTARTAALPRRSVGLLEWADPVFVMANWAPELAEVANGDPVLGHKGEYSTAIDGRELLGADPEFLIVAPCGFDLERSLREQPRLEQYPWWAELRAVQSGNVFFADGNLFFNRSGTTLARTAEIIAEILHDVRFGDTFGLPWRRMGRQTRDTALPVSSAA